MGFIKQDAENKNIIKKKKEEAMTLLFALPLLFLSNNDPVFCALIFAAHILDPFYKVLDSRKLSGQPDEQE